MTITIDHEQCIRPDFAIGSQRSALGAIRDPAISFAIWRRSMAPEVASTLACWLERAELEVDTILEPGDPLPGGLEVLPCGAIVEDVEQLLSEFRGLSDARRVRLTLTVKTTDSCRKFHADYVRLRLITTYVGPGTEWVPGRAVDRKLLAHPPSHPREANRKIVRDARAIRRTRAGDVLLLKGERATRDRSAVHRSPPIEARGLKRLVLTLTTVD